MRTPRPQVGRVYLAPPPDNPTIRPVATGVWLGGKKKSFGDVASGASHDIGARNAIEIFSSRPSFGDVASATSHDIGARNAIENFLRSTKLWRCCEWR